MKKLILLSVIFLSILSIEVQAQDNPQPVYETKSDYSTGLLFQIDHLDVGYEIEFSSTKWKIIEKYYTKLIDGIDEKSKVTLIFDFEPPLEGDEYHLVLNSNYNIDETNQGFNILIKGDDDWLKLDFNNLMLYIDEE